MSLFDLVQPVRRAGEAAGRTATALGWRSPLAAAAAPAVLPVLGLDAD